MNKQGGGLGEPQCQKPPEIAHLLGDQRVCYWLRQWTPPSEGRRACVHLDEQFTRETLKTGLSSARSAIFHVFIKRSRVKHFQTGIRLTLMTQEVRMTTLSHIIQEETKVQAGFWAELRFAAAVWPKSALNVLCDGASQRVWLILSPNSQRLGPHAAKWKHGKY